MRFQLTDISDISVSAFLVISHNITTFWANICLIKSMTMNRYLPESRLIIQEKVDF